MSVVLLFTVVVRLAMFVVLVATFWLVANSWAPFTASVDVAVSAPAVTPVMVRVPLVPVTSTTVPPVATPTVIGPALPPLCWTIPEVPFWMLVIAVVLLAMLVVEVAP